MYKKTIFLQEIKLIGISVITNNSNELDSKEPKIAKLMQDYFSSGISNKIANKVKLGTTYCVYTEYESDYSGNYRYFIGEEVSSFSDSGLENLIIPEQKYLKFTNNPGKMPDVCIKMWQDIWQMDDKIGRRKYIADFEVYDSRSYDSNNAVLDIFIGIE